MLFTIVTGTDRWYDVTLLSIRTAGIAARVIVITLPEKTFDPYFDRVIQLTSVEIYRMESPGGASTPDMHRHPWILAFLTEHEGEFDRVFMFDAFDCYFHRDPFEELNFDEMAFFEEGWDLRVAGDNEMWVEICFNRSFFYTMCDHPTLCSGTMYGSARVFVAFERLLLDQRFWVHCSLDQPILNVIVYTGVMKATGVPYRTVPCTGPILTLSHCPRSIRLENGVWEAFNNESRVPHVVHQWKAYDDFRQLYVERCNMTDYIHNVEGWTDWESPIRGTY
jgi:hypothetical protein